MARTTLTCLCSILAFIGAACTSDGPGPEAAIDALVDRYIELDKFNGTLLVARDREVIYERAHGLADHSTGEELTLDHRFRLASVTKQLTGVGVLVLVQEGLLALGDPVEDYLPGFPYPGVTVRHLLTNTSGLPDYGGLLESHWDVANAGSGRRKIVTNRDVYELLLQEAPPAEFEPGDRYAYSNTGFNLLALVVEDVSGQTFPEFMRTRVFEPAGMKDTFVNAPDGTLPTARRARGHGLDEAGTGWVVADEHYQNGLYGDGGVYSTVRDLFRYDQALYDGALVGPDLLAEAVSPARLNDGTASEYGFGWSVITDERGDFVAHGGGWAGFSPFFVRDYHNGNAVIQLTNRPGIRRGELAFAIYELLHGGRLELPEAAMAEARPEESESGL